MSPDDENAGFSGIWIIVKESGLPIATVYPHKEEGKDPLLFAGLLFAIRNMMSSFKIGQLTSFSTSTHTIVITPSDDLISVLAIEKSSNVHDWDTVLHRIHERIEFLYQNRQQKSGYIDSDKFSFVEEEIRSMVTQNVLRLKLALNRKTRNKQSDKDDKKKRVRDKLRETGL